MPPVAPQLIALDSLGEFAVNAQMMPLDSGLCLYSSYLFYIAAIASFMSFRMFLARADVISRIGRCRGEADGDCRR